MTFALLSFRAVCLTGLLGMGLASSASAASVDLCESLQALLAKMDSALGKVDAGGAAGQVDMFQIKLEATKVKLGLSEQADDWPDPQSKPAADAVSDAVKGPDGGRFDAAFAAETLMREGPVLVAGLLAGCSGTLPPARFDPAQAVE